MKIKALPLFAMLITLIGITAGAAHAQGRRKVTLEASVPFEFVVGNRAFPAGNYVFEIATGLPKTSDRAAVLVVRGRESRLYAAVATGITDGTNARIGHKVEFMRDGDRVFLSKVWQQGSPAGLSVHTAQALSTDVQQESQVVILDALAVGGGI